MRNSQAAGRDMILSLAVILVPCMLIFWFFNRTPDAPEVPRADWKPVVAQARADASYQVLAPANLPDSFKPVRARWGDGQLQLGFHTADGGDHGTYFEMKQLAGAQNGAFVRETTQGAHDDGTTTLNGRSWTRMVTDSGDNHCLRSIVAASRASTTVVCADAPYEAVEAFASTLA